jgi:diguanylate cyclase (GGDEF)-like protein
MKIYRIKRALNLVLIILIVTVLLACPAYFIYQNAKMMVVEELGKNAINIAATISTFIENNVDYYEDISIDQYEVFGEQTGLLNEDSLNSGSSADLLTDEEAVLSSRSEEFYREELTGVFKALMQATGAENIYVEKRISETMKAYLFDDDYSRKSRYQNRGKLTETELAVFNDGIISPTDVMSDGEIGEFIAGYAPILERETGAVIGIAAVEFSLTYANSITNGIRNIIYLSFGVIILLTSVVVFMLLKSRQKYLRKDYLTELCNKSYFERHIRTDVRVFRQTGKPLSLLMIDIDHFKTINDTLGHLTGDKVLKAVSEIILKLTRSNDLCARYGGDEFVVSLHSADQNQAAVIADRIRAEVSRLEIFTQYNERVTITLSIGIAELKNGMDAEDLLDHADQAMYRSKNAGKDRLTVFIEDWQPGCNGA